MFAVHDGERVLVPGINYELDDRDFNVWLERCGWDRHYEEGEVYCAYYNETHRTYLVELSDGIIIPIRHLVPDTEWLHFHTTYVIPHVDFMVRTGFHKYDGS